MNQTDHDMGHHAAAHMAELLSRQRSAFVQEGAPSLQQRRANLRRLKAVVLQHQDEILAALQQDFGQRSAHETAIMEIAPLLQTIHYQHAQLRHWMRPDKRHVPVHLQPGQAWVQHQPLGVIGIMVPWNYPVQLALIPLATALAAGNRALIKPSEYTPATSALLQRLLAQAFSADQVAVCLGDAAVGEAFASLPFDHLIFTGSTEVGRKVMQTASANLVPLTLELGGKSPVIIDAGHPIPHAATAIAFGKLANSGQTCIAPDYVLLPSGQEQAFVQAYDDAVRTLYPAGTASKDYTAIVNDKHHQRLLALLDDARALGARIIEVGAPSEQAAQHPRSMRPMVVLNATPKMRILQEEIFGPLLPVLSYQHIDEAIHHVTARPRPLALYFFGDEGPNRQSVLSRTTSGNVSINNTLMHCALEDLPFGGVGPSGMGAYHGIEGFKALSHAKGVFQQGRRNISSVLRPPFGSLADRVLAWMLR